MKKILALAGLALTPACASNHAAPPPAAPQLNGGTIAVFSEPEATLFSVILYSQASAMFPAIPDADGRCTVIPNSTAGSSVISVVDLDPGPVTASSGAASIDLSAGSGDYGGLAAGRLLFPGAFDADIQTTGPVIGFSGGTAPSFASTWTFVNAGTAGGLAAGTLVSADIPGQITQDPTFASQGSIIPGTAANITWTGGEGALRMHVFAAGDNASADCYVPGTATNFVIPAGVTLALGEQASAVVSAENAKMVEIDGRQVLVLSAADNLD